MEPTEIPRAITEIEIPGAKLYKRGKVREIYDLGEYLLIVATDRLSAFDVVFSQGIPDKGVILTQLSKFWLGFFDSFHKHHFITDDVAHFGQPFADYADLLRGRAMLTRKLTIFPVECIVRGYLVGSGYKEYAKTGAISGIKLEPGLKFAEKLPEPIFTPSTKAEIGEHDVNITFEQMKELIGAEYAEKLREKSLRLYERAYAYAYQRGIIIADTKFEFGLDASGEVVIADEIFTPDSSRFWAVADYKPGANVPSFDKQIIRDYLEQTDWDKRPPAPPLPADIVVKTAQRYREVFELLTDSQADWAFHD